MVGFRLSDGLVLDGRVEGIVDAGRDHGFVEVAGLPSVNAGPFGVTVELSGVLPLFPL
ncbi:MAG: hypothetical protein J07HQX50_01880 [Haloquadratum sp. J07HQX50]|nr:MAG: hypothetical protein J07HQX50_01880 [Haloquadratum sp. J07HQX50]